MYRSLCELKFSFIWDKCPRVQLLYHYGNCMFNFTKKLPNYLSRAAMPFPPLTYEESSFLAFSLALGIITIVSLSYM